MPNLDGETDEDKQIARLQIHRDLIGWIIDELEKQGIPSVRTRGNHSKGDILIVNEKDVARVKDILRDFQQHFDR